MIPNTQTPAPIEQNLDRVYVHSIWPTIQGEGPFAGSHAIFIRLYGCNLQCPFCDTDYTSQREAVSLGLDPEESNIAGLTGKIRKMTPIRNAFTITRKQLVVITGGEPFRQNLAGLVAALKVVGFEVQIETNGTLFQDNVCDRATVVCSPKTPKIHPDLAVWADAYKYVLDADHVDPSDGLPAGTLGKFSRTARPPDGWSGDIFVQPLDEQNPEKNAANLQACVQSVLRFGYRLCIQTHKLANVP